LTFYAVHAAAAQPFTIGALGIFVFAASLAKVASGFLWRQVDRWQTRAVLALSCATAALAAVLALNVDEFAGPGNLFAHAAVFFLITLAYEGMINGRMLYLIKKASAPDLPYMVASAHALVWAVGIVVAFVAGYLASARGLEWPIVIILVFNLAAAAWTVRLPSVRDKVTAPA
jgi:hypothetical protein